MKEPDWMAAAVRASSAFRPATRAKPNASHFVYVVLLHNPKRSQAWGLYVGQTARDPDLRFDQHKAGYRASRAVKRYGLRLLPALFEHLNPLEHWESLEIEEALAEAFRGCGVSWVEGGH